WDRAGAVDHGEIGGKGKNPRSTTGPSARVEGVIREFNLGKTTRKSAETILGHAGAQDHGDGGVGLRFAYRADLQAFCRCTHHDSCWAWRNPIAPADSGGICRSRADA